MKDEHVVYQPSGVCSSRIEFDVENGIVHNVRFTGGCAGNTQGVGALAEGMEVTEIAKRLSGIQCRPNGHSCPDEFAKAAQQYLDRQ